MKLKFLTTKKKRQRPRSRLFYSSQWKVSSNRYLFLFQQQKFQTYTNRKLICVQLYVASLNHPYLQLQVSDVPILLNIRTDYGKRGQILSIPRHLALKELLLPGMAVYASPENLNVYKDIIIAEDSIQYSSEIVRKVRAMAYSIVNINLNSSNAWTVVDKSRIKALFLCKEFQKCHIKPTAFLIITYIFRRCPVSHDSAFQSS